LQKEQEKNMLIKQQKIKLLRAVRHQGQKKNGDDYLFYSGSWLDDESNVLKMNLSNELSKDIKVTKILDTAKELPVIIDVVVYQSGFNLRGTVVKLEVV
jgi:hypothetical protein